MANKKKVDLAPGFEEVPLQEGFEEVPLKSTAIQSLGEKVKDLGNSALETGKNIAKEGIQDASDFGRGAVQGLSAGLSDEAIAALKASLPADEEDKGKDWKQLYRKYQEIEQAKNSEAKERSPYLYGGAEIGGMIAPALLTAGATAPAQLGAKLTAMQLAKKVGAGALTGAVQGAVVGGTTSEKGKLINATPEEEEKLKADVLGGAITGGVVSGALHGAIPLVKNAYGAVKEKLGNKVENYISDSPFWSQARKSKELGEKGINIYSEKAIRGDIENLAPDEIGPKVNPGLIKEDTLATTDLVDRIYGVDSKLGQKVGQAIDNATDQGVTVDLTKPMADSILRAKDLLEKDAQLMANPKAQKLYDTIFRMSDEGELNTSKLTPREVQTLRQDVIDFSDSIKLKNPDIASLGYQFQGQIGDLLKSAVPEYKIAAERFEQFRRLVPETLISGSTPVDISGIKLGNLKNDEAKLFQSAKKMLQGSRIPGSGTGDAKETFKNLLNGVSQFEKNEGQRVASGQIPSTEVLPKLIEDTNGTQASALEKMIKDKADNSALLQQAWRVNPQENLGTSVKGALFGRGSVMNLANKYGLHKETLLKPLTSPVKLTQKIYSSSESELRGMGQKMSEIPGLQSVGKALLQGLDNKDNAGVNAAIFSIMQNPQARILINAEDLDSEKKENE